jgi:hypothetical protein
MAQGAKFYQEESMPKKKAGPATGPLAISANGRYFLDGKGAPCFWQGDTQWELLRKFTEQDARTVVEKRIAQGFNVFQIMFNGVPDGNQGVSGTRPWIDNNPQNLSEPYFQHADAIIGLCDELGVTFVVGVYHKSEAGFFNLQSARQYARYVANRYRDIKNIIWCMYPVEGDASTAICKEIAAGLNEGDKGKHLITVHPDPSPASSSWMHKESWLAFNTIQTFSTEILNHSMVMADYNRVPIKPAVNGEARYETDGDTTPLQCRRSAYWSYLAGGFYSFGHYGNWHAPHEWQAWIDSPATAQMKICGDLFRSLSWWKLAPDQTIISGIADQNVAARSTDGDWLLVYLPALSPVTVNMNKITASSRVEASWIDPQSGVASTAGIFDNSGTSRFSPPAGWEDAILLCKAQQ